MSSYASLAICFVLLGPVRDHSCHPNDDEISRKFAVACNDFGSRLICKITDQKNFFISPVSVFMALTLLYLGAKQDTKKNMDNGLQASKNLLSLELLKRAITVTFQNDLHSIQNETYNLRSANGVFLDKSCNFEETFVKDVTSLLPESSTTRKVDFMTDSEGVTDQINTWMEEATGHMIKNFLKSVLPSSTKLALFNAIYFNGLWELPFDPDNSQGEWFYQFTGEKKWVTFLRHKGLKFLHCEHDGYIFLQMSYSTNRYTSMLLALPTAPSQFPDLQMTSGVLSAVYSRQREVEFKIMAVPKVTLEYTINLKQQLINMDMGTIFYPSADFSGISKDSGVQLSDVQHSAKIEIYELGSKAAAGTGIPLVGGVSDDQRPEFYANRPFLFYIIKHDIALVLFSGRITDI